MYLSFAEPRDMKQVVDEFDAAIAAELAEGETKMKTSAEKDEDHKNRVLMLLQETAARNPEHFRHDLHVDEIVTGTKLTPSEVVRALMLLELKRLITRLPGDRFTLRKKEKK